MTNEQLQKIVDAVAAEWGMNFGGIYDELAIEVAKRALGTAVEPKAMTKILAQELRETAEVLENNGLVYWVEYCRRGADELERLQPAWEVERMANGPKGDAVRVPVEPPAVPAHDTRAIPKTLLKWAMGFVCEYGMNAEDQWYPDAEDLIKQLTLVLNYEHPLVPPEP